MPCGSSSKSQVGSVKSQLLNSTKISAPSVTFARKSQLASLVEALGKPTMVTIVTKCNAPCKDVLINPHESIARLAAAHAHIPLEVWLCVCLPTKQEEELRIEPRSVWIGTLRTSCYTGPYVHFLFQPNQNSLAIVLPSLAKTSTGLGAQSSRGHCGLTVQTLGFSVWPRCQNAYL